MEKTNYSLETLQKKFDNLKGKIEQIDFEPDSEDYLNSFLKIIATDFSNPTFSSSLGIEDQVITDAIFKKKLGIKIFTLDTGRLFPETYALLQDIEKQYNQKIQIYFPNQQEVEEYVKKNGINGFYESTDLRHQCCNIRKVNPLNRALQGTDLWVTGIRKNQSDFRAKEDKIIEIDTERSIIKAHPLYYWSFSEIQNHIKVNKIPYNTLHDKNYPSIGCQPCTRAIAVGEDFRAGRWWWEQESQKECGLHFNEEGQPVRNKNK